MRLELDHDGLSCELGESPVAAPMGLFMAVFSAPFWAYGYGMLAWNASTGALFADPLFGLFHPGMFALVGSVVGLKGLRFAVGPLPRVRLRVDAEHVRYEWRLLGLRLWRRSLPLRELVGTGVVIDQLELRLPDGAVRLPLGRASYGQRQDIVDAIELARLAARSRPAGEPAPPPAEILALLRGPDRRDPEAPR